MPTLSNKPKRADRDILVAEASPERNPPSVAVDPRRTAVLAVISEHHLMPKVASVLLWLLVIISSALAVIVWRELLLDLP